MSLSIATGIAPADWLAAGDAAIVTAAHLLWEQNQKR